MYVLIVIIGIASTTPGSGYGALNTHVLGTFNSLDDCKLAARENAHGTGVSGLAYGVNWYCTKMGRPIP
jgi:hypothetical protein